MITVLRNCRVFAPADLGKKDILIAYNSLILNSPEETGLSASGANTARCRRLVRQRVSVRLP